MALSRVRRTCALGGRGGNHWGRSQKRRKDEVPGDRDWGVGGMSPYARAMRVPRNTFSLSVGWSGLVSPGSPSAAPTTCTVRHLPLVVCLPVQWLVVVGVSCVLATRKKPWLKRERPNLLKMVAPWFSRPGDWPVVVTVYNHNVSTTATQGSRGCCRHGYSNIGNSSGYVLFLVHGSPPHRVLSRTVRWTAETAAGRIHTIYYTTGGELNCCGVYVHTLFRARAIYGQWAGASGMMVMN